MTITSSGTRCVSMKDAARKVGFSRSSLYATLADPDSDFPRPIEIGRRRYLIEAELDNWILSRPRVGSKLK